MNGNDKRGKGAEKGGGKVRRREEELGTFEKKREE